MGIFKFDAPYPCKYNGSDSGLQVHLPLPRNVERQWVNMFSSATEMITSDKEVNRPTVSDVRNANEHDDRLMSVDDCDNIEGRGRLVIRLTGLLIASV